MVALPAPPAAADGPVRPPRLIVLTRTVPARPVAGQVFRYIVTVRNVGEVPSGRVRLTQVFARGVKVLRAPGRCTIRVRPDRSTVAHCGWRNIPYKRSGTVSFTLYPDPTLAAGSVVVGRPSVMYGKGQTAKGGTGTATGTVIRRSDLAVRADATAAEVRAGGSIVVEIDVLNRGPSAADHVTVSGTLPPGIEYGGSAAARMAKQLCTVRGRGLVCDLGRLMPGQRKELRLTLLAAKNAAPGPRTLVLHVADTTITVPIRVPATGASQAGAGLAMAHGSGGTKTATAATYIYGVVSVPVPFLPPPPPVTPPPPAPKTAVRQVPKAAVRPVFHHAAGVTVPPRQLPLFLLITIFLVTAVAGAAGGGGDVDADGADGEGGDGAGPSRRSGWRVPWPIAGYRLLGAILLLSELLFALLGGVGRPGFSAPAYVASFSVLGGVLASWVLLAGMVRAVPAQVRGAAVLVMGTTAVFHARLLPAEPPMSLGFFLVVPVLLLADWFVDPPAVRLRAGTARRWLAGALGYVGVILAAGQLLHRHPYPFLNPGSGGYLRVAASCATPALFMIVLATVLVRTSGRRPARTRAEAVR